MGDAARPIITRYSELTDASTVDLPTLNTPLANALAALGGGGSLTFSSLTDAATVDLPTLNGPLGTALDGKAPLSHTHTVSQITDFPALATVATSGAYADLTGTPSLVVNFGDLGDATTVDLPTVNTPLATALGLKLENGDSATFVDLTSTGVFAGASGSFSGSLGINTTSPRARLEVYHPAGILSSSAGNAQVRIERGDNPNYSAVLDYFSGNSVKWSAGLSDAGNFSGSTGEEYIIGPIKSNPVFLITPGEDVGIGTTTPGEKLEVAGNIKSSGTIQPGTYTVATLPTGVAGMRATVSDSDKHAQGNFGNTVVAAGAGTSYVVPVFFDGTNWIIA